MGLPPDGVLPGPFLAFARFSVALFEALAERGAVRPDFEPFTVPPEGFLLLESYPTAAWRELGLPPLRAKSKAKADDPQQGCTNIQRLLPVQSHHAVNHDEAQALVAGLAGVAVAVGNEPGYRAVGAPLHYSGGVPREGYIVLPTLQCLGKATERVQHRPRPRPPLAAVTGEPCLHLTLALTLTLSLPFGRCRLP